MDEEHPLAELGATEPQDDSPERDPIPTMNSGPSRDPVRDDDPYEDTPTGGAKYSMREENKERGNWTWGFELSFASVAAVCSLEIFLALVDAMYARDGLVYLFAFFLMTALLGAPLLYLEMVIGQFSSSGVLTCWEFFPLFKGIGVAMLVTSGLVSLYKSTLMAWVLYYLFESIKANVTDTALPWANPKRLQPDCRSAYNATLGVAVSNCSSLGADVLHLGGGKCWRRIGDDVQPIAFIEESMAAASRYILFAEKPLARVFFECQFIGQPVMEPLPLGDIGPPRTAMVIPALLVWLLTLGLLWKGVKSLGKVTMVTAPLSLVLLVVMVIRSATLPGARKGLAYYTIPDTTFNILDPVLWYRAGLESIRMLSLTYGVHITYNSYSRFHTDTYRYMWVTCLGMLLALFLATAMTAGFTGFLAHHPGQDIAAVTRKGLNPLFVIIPEVFNRLPNPSAWCIVFFLMLALIGVGSLLGLVETVVTGIIDQFPRFRNRRWVALIVTCVLGFLLQLPGTTNGGLFWTTWLYSSINTWNLLFIAIFECVAYIVYCCVSLFKFRHDVAAMTGWNCGCVPVICTWGCQTQLLFSLAPLSLVLMLCTGAASSAGPRPRPGAASSVDPGYMRHLTLCVTSLPLLLFAATTIGQLIYYARSSSLRMIDILYPKLWKPALTQHETRRQTVGKSFKPYHV